MSLFILDQFDKGQCDHCLDVLDLFLFLFFSTFNVVWHWMSSIAVASLFTLQFLMHDWQMMQIFNMWNKNIKSHSTSSSFVYFIWVFLGDSSSLDNAAPKIEGRRSKLNINNPLSFSSEDFRLWNRFKILIIIIQLNQTWEILFLFGLQLFSDFQYYLRCLLTK